MNAADTVELIAARTRTRPELVEELLEDERRRGRVERTQEGGWTFTELGWAEIGAPLAGIDRPRGRT